MATYLANIPQATDIISISQGDVLGNFQILGASVNIDHVALTDGTATERMKHKYVRLKEQAIPVAPTLADEGGFYVNSVDHALYFKPRNDGVPEKISSGGGGGGNILAWGLINITTSTILYQSNIASITYLGAFNWRLNFTIPLSSANFVVVLTYYAASIVDPSEIASFDHTINSFRIISGSSHLDVVNVSVIGA